MEQERSIIHIDMEDISDRKEIENRARETEARYKALVESLNVGVISGTDKDLLQINNTLANLLGYKSSDELKGMSVERPVGLDKGTAF